MKWFIGIDSGSTMCKAVLFDGKKIRETYTCKTGWNPKLSSRECLELLLEKHSLSRNEVCIAVTGYGREAIDFADHKFTEITCHAFGAMALSSGIGGVVDIGGQDSKVIHIENNRVVNFFMNDKCAAGTGRFLSMACDTLGVSLEDIDGFADKRESIPVNSMCTVFAESEIIGLLSMEKDRSKILTGVIQSIAQKIRQMTGRVDFAADVPLLMTGGLSGSEVIVKTIAKTIGLNVVTHKHSLYAGAVGACICAINKGVPAEEI